MGKEHRILLLSLYALCLQTSTPPMVSMYLTEAIVLLLLSHGNRTAQCNVAQRYHVLYRAGICMHDDINSSSSSSNSKIETKEKNSRADGTD